MARASGPKIPTKSPRFPGPMCLATDGSPLTCLAAVAGSEELHGTLLTAGTTH
jgi:hypothetical protein